MQKKESFICLLTQKETEKEQKESDSELNKSSATGVKFYAGNAATSLCGEK